jgi:hypothetical protein
LSLHAKSCGGQFTLLALSMCVALEWVPSRSWLGSPVLVLAAPSVLECEFLM